MGLNDSTAAKWLPQFGAGAVYWSPGEAPTSTAQIKIQVPSGGQTNSSLITTMLLQFDMLSLVDLTYPGGAGAHH